MNTTKFIGEHLLPGQIGYFLTILSLVAALLASFAFAKAFFSKELSVQAQWNKLAKIAFYIEALCIFSCFVVLFYIISNHLFEYKYAYMHSDKNLPYQYLLSCFWEGQEGSFLLWSFWHCVLGLFVLARLKRWNNNINGVMMVLNFVQFVLATMVVGLFIFDAKLGSSPFLLLREEMSWPILSRPDYLHLIKDGTGLNTLLQNYWMVIHPPILFLGFASTTIPFAFAVTGLIKKEHDWMDHCLPWASFSAGILGLGIMMGAAWAYESLTFGGYWAWDPVENASLVPWMTLVSAIHACIIYRKTGGSLKTTYFFFGISFLLVLYSTFLTRSGILGDTSVHAFTDLGMNTQLLVFLLIFVLPYFALFMVRMKDMKAPQKEDEIKSREFWMLVGSLILFLSAVVIISITSIPVFNKLFGTKIAPPEDAAFAHNQVQVFVAIIIGLLTAVGQYLKFKGTTGDYFKEKIKLPLLITIVVTAVVYFFVGVKFTEKGIGFTGAIYVALFASIFTVVANLFYFFSVQKGKLKSAGASIGHVGFGLVLVGILISSSNKTILSWNTTGISPLRMESKKSPAGNPKENITLFEGIATDMGKYMVTYVQDSFDILDKRFFVLKFKEKKTEEEFFLYPDVLKNNKGMEGFSANPSSKHYWNKDIFVYVTSFQDHSTEDTSSFLPHQMAIGDSIFYSNGYVKLDKVLVNPNTNRPAGSNELVLQLSVTSKEGLKYQASPSIILEGMSLQANYDTVKAQNLVLSFNKVVDQQKGLLEIGMKESASLTNLITLKAYEFPFINILWIGVIVMVFGFGLATFNRVKKFKAK
ncbi:MAG: cytochrome c biogenesis protein CcsA [Bacteroidetes bacterium]|nr:cytochrome c biogenesis protein CcsA [Bacteroidota bacterium]